MGAQASYRPGQGHPAPMPRGAQVCPAQGQVSPITRCRHVGAPTWLTPMAAPSKLEVTIFFSSIPSMPNAFQ